MYEKAIHEEEIHEEGIQDKSCDHEGREARTT